LAETYEVSATDIIHDINELDAFMLSWCYLKSLELRTEIKLFSNGSFSDRSSVQNLNRREVPV
jgi:hypothetical protein